MSEYWKSQPRKFCEFCKCWITDNKPSVSFHEKGKRHQENVQLRIEEAKKKGTQAEKRKLKESGYLQKMEKAAMEAFKRDMEENPELAEQYKKSLPQVVEGPQLPEGYKKPPTPPKPEPEQSTKKTDEDQTEPEWYEAMSEMGYPYYWRPDTGESVWVAPEKYITLAEQGLEPSPTIDPAPVDDTRQQKPPDDPLLPPGLESIPLPGELPAPESPPSPSESESDPEEEGKQDRHARGVYGVWSRVQKEQESEQVDLQLPKVEIVETIAIPVPKEETRVKFKEKKVLSLGSNKGPVAFKKRKLGDGARNVRRRNADDD